MSLTRPFANRRRILATVVALLVIIALAIWAILGFSGEDAPSASNTTNSSEGSSSSATSSSAKPSEKKEPKKDGKREDEDDPSVVAGPVEGTGSFNMDGLAPVQGATFD